MIFLSSLYPYVGHNELVIMTFVTLPIFFLFWQNIFLGHFSGFFMEISTFLIPMKEKSQEIADYMFSPQKKMSHTFIVSGALKVNTC